MASTVRWARLIDSSRFLQRRPVIYPLITTAVSTCMSTPRRSPIHAGRIGDGRALPVQRVARRLANAGWPRSLRWLWRVAALTTLARSPEAISWPPRLTEDEMDLALEPPSSDVDDQALDRDAGHAFGGASTARRTEFSTASMSEITPALRPRDFWWPRPMISILWVRRTGSRCLRPVSAGRSCRPPWTNRYRAR